jgi:hypothetical protein
MLIESCRLDKDHYLSKSAYNATLINIAQASQIDFEKITDPSAYRASIESLQDQYKSLKQTTEYELLPKASSSQPSSFYEQNNRSKENQLANECTIEIAMLHKAQLGNVKLTDTHINQIKETALAEISKLKRFTDADKEGAAENIYKAIASDKWRCSLNEANALKTEKAKSNTAAFGNILNILARLDEQKKDTKSLDDLLPIFEKQKDLIEKVSELNLSSMQQSLIKTFPKTDTLNALIKDSTFLAKYNDRVINNIFNELKDARDLDVIRDKIFTQCEETAVNRVNTNITDISFLTRGNRSSEILGLVRSKELEYLEIRPYVCNAYTKSELDDCTNILKIDLMAHSSDTLSSDQKEAFRNEMIALNRFSQPDLQKALEIAETKGLLAATSYGEDININRVLDKLSIQRDFWDLSRTLPHKEYIDAVAKDSQVMSYVDRAIASDKTLDETKCPIALSDYESQRNINQGIANDPLKSKDIGSDFER